MPKCRGCGAEIVWIRTLGRKSIPCDPELVTYWERKNAKGKVVTPNGEVISCVFSGDPNKATGVGFTTHFATCPVADRFRRDRHAAD